MRKMLCVVVTSMGILFANCNSPVFTPIASPNPWQDDYSFLSSMDNYRLWGTYNVHDLVVNWVIIIICTLPMPF